MNQSVRPLLDRNPARDQAIEPTLIGAVNANRQHYLDAVMALQRADQRWLDSLITRRVPAEHWTDALVPQKGDIKVIVDFA